MVKALDLARDSAGNSSAARIAMMAMTTSNSIKVKALLQAVRELGDKQSAMDELDLGLR
jgi:hypothetical protein